MTLYRWALIAALLPVCLLAFYILGKDKDKPEPASLLLKAGFFGILSGLLVIIAAIPFPGFYNLFPGLQETVLGACGDALLTAAIPEEATKLFMLWLVIRKNPYFDEYLDGVVYATLVGLGFAGFENILYLFSNLDNFVSIAIVRALFSVPGHFFYAVVMGYFISLAYFGSYSQGRRIQYWILAFVVPVLLHFIFDAILFSMEVTSEMAGVLLILFIAFCIWVRKYALHKIEKMRSADKMKQSQNNIL